MHHREYSQYRGFAIAGCIRRSVSIIIGGFTIAGDLLSQGIFIIIHLLSQEYLHIQDTTSTRHLHQNTTIRIYNQ